MRKFFAIIVAATTLLSLFSGCGKKELKPIEKAQARAVEIGEQYLAFEITAEEAKELLGSIEVPETKGEGHNLLETHIKVLAALIMDEINFPEEDTRPSVKLQIDWILSRDYTK